MELEELLEDDDDDDDPPFSKEKTDFAGDDEVKGESGGDLWGDDSALDCIADEEPFPAEVGDDAAANFALHARLLPLHGLEIHSIQNSACDIFSRSKYTHSRGEVALRSRIPRPTVSTLRKSKPEGDHVYLRLFRRLF